MDRLDELGIFVRIVDEGSLVRAASRLRRSAPAVTRAAMAIVMAEEGGIGIIDRGFRAGDIEPQVMEVAAVKRRQHGIITDPHSIGHYAASENRRRSRSRMAATRRSSAASVTFADTTS